MFSSLAYAMGGAAGGAGGAGGGSMGAFIPLILMFAIFYFLLIRPQQKKAKEHKSLLSNLRKGDEIVTSGGLHGTITAVKDGIVTLEIAPKIRVKVSQSAVAGVARPGQGAPAAAAPAPAPEPVKEEKAEKEDKESQPKE